jgi:hypothetical protein
LKKVYKIDTNGFYVGDAILEDNEEIPSDCIEIPFPDGLFLPAKLENGKWITTLSQDELNSILGYTLDDLKQKKINELDEACKNAILGNFIVTLNETDYEFTYDMASQSRFNGVGILFINNLITEVPWTAYQNGERVRVTLTKDDFNTISLAALAHQNDNVTKYSNLYVQVMNANTSDELNQIKW